jgi:hypothetical protein
MPDKEPYLEPVPELDPQGLGPKPAETVDPAALQGSKSTGKKWAILLGFAAFVFLVVASVNHKGDQPAAPPAAATAAAPAPGSTNAVLPQGAPATKSGQ